MKQFLIRLFERAARSALATFLAVLVANQAEWSAYVGVGLAPIVSILLTNASRLVGDSNSGSFVK